MLGEVTLEDEVTEAAASVMSPVVQPDEALDRKLLHARIKWALSRLTKKEAAAIRLRFGLDERPPRTYEQIALLLKYTSHERPRQLVAKALRRLRHPKLSRELAESFVDVCGGEP
jgi:DNA-directed RNA polymerase sigma subunit (sigma70/sigma32)